MKPGRELDALVAEKVMGWTRWDGVGDYAGRLPMFCDWGYEAGLAVYTDEATGDVDFYFAPSTDIAAAWEVVEKFTGDERHPLVRYDGLRPEGRPRWTAAFDANRGDANTAPHAICLAALKVIK